MRAPDPLPSASSAPVRLSGSDLLAGAAIAAAGLGAQWPALRAGFVFDDHPFVEHSALVHGPLARIWSGAGGADYWPLTWTSFWIDERLWGPGPAGFHAVNVVLHVAVALLLWRVLRALRMPGAWLAGMLLAVHPVTVESVAWISERKNVLSGALLLASLLAWIRHDDRGGSRWWVASWVLFLLALLAKTSGVLFPLALLGLALWRRGRLDGRDLRRTAPFLVLSLVLGSVTAWFQWTRAIPGVAPSRSIAERVGGSAWALLSYLQKAFVPVDLGFVYPRWPVEPGDARYWIPLAAVLVAVVLLVRAGGRLGAPLRLGLGWHALMVLPVLGLVDIAYFHVGPVSNHLQYLALLGPVALMAAGGAWMARGRWRLPASLAIAAALAALAALTWSRSAGFRDDLSLWRMAVREQPQSLFATWMLADQLGERGAQREALEVLDRLAMGARDPATSARARALWLFHSRRWSEALAEAQRAESVRPDPDFQVEVGRLLAQAGRPREATAILDPLVRASPRSTDARYWLAVSLARAGEPAAAAELLRDGVRLAPEDDRFSAALELLARQAGR